MTPLPEPTPTETPTPTPTATPTPNAHAKKHHHKAVSTTAETPTPTPVMENTPAAAAPSAKLEMVAPSAAATAEPDPNTVKLVDDVSRTAQQIDRKSLGADDQRRAQLADALVASAKQALADHDYAAADSLATKASVLLAPLPKVP